MSSSNDQCFVLGGNNGGSSGFVGGGEGVEVVSVNVLQNLRKKVTKDVKQRVSTIIKI